MQSQTQPDGQPSTPAGALLRLMTGFWTTQAVYVAAKLGIADLLGGHERTEAEYRALLSASGLALTRVMATQSPRSIIEAVPQ
jgi:hypothetical protein